MPKRFDITDTRPFLNARHRMPMMASHIQPDGRTVAFKGKMIVEIWVNPVTGHAEPFIALSVINGRFPSVDATFHLLEDWRPHAPEPAPAPKPERSEADIIADLAALDDAVVESLLEGGVADPEPPYWLKLTAVWLLVISCLMAIGWFLSSGGGS